MGLLVDDNGHYRGWLAAFLCCCAAVNEDEHPSERERDKVASTSAESTYCNQPQSTALPFLPSLNTTPAIQNDKSEIDAGSRCDSRQSDLASSLPKSFHFDPDYLLPQSETKETDVPGYQLPQSPTYGSTSPTRRVRLNRSESVQKKGLIPLPLGPVVLRDPSEITYATSQTSSNREALSATRRHQGSDSTQDLLGNASYQETRETPYQRCGRQSTEALAKRASPTDTATHIQAPSPAIRLGPAKGNAQSTSLSSSVRQHARDLSNSSSHSTLVDQRPSRTTPRLQRKRSNQSKSSFGNAEDSDVEKEVLELNTIVEERRAEKNKNRSPTGHVPAVAPSMQVRARSQTLTDIGSALSRPLGASQHDLRDVESNEMEVGAGARPQTSISDSRGPGSLSSATPTTSTTTNIASANTSLPSITTQNTRTTEPMTSYEHSQRLTTTADPAIQRSHDNDHTTASASSSLTALDSDVAYTLEPSSSSPTKSSKRYSRSLMITPLGAKPPAIEDFVIRNDYDHDHDLDGKSIVDDDVGVAL